MEEKITTKIAVMIGNAFFKGLNDGRVGRIYDANSFWICIEDPNFSQEEDEDIDSVDVVVGAYNIKIDKLNGTVENFILPNEKNFEILDKACEIDLSQI